MLWTKRAFHVIWKVFFIIFKGISVAKNCLRPESAPLRNDYSAKPMEDKIESSESILLRTSLCSYLVSWNMYLLLVRKLPLWAAQKWLFHCEYFYDWAMKKDVFCGINFCDVGMLWKKCRIYFCDPNVLTNFFKPSLKKKIRYIWE